MSEKNDGGPAFPRDERFLGHNGMSLRDWFAGQALAGLMSAHTGDGQWTAIGSNAAAWAYEAADNMIAERNK